MKAVIVDDEAASRSVLRQYLHKYCPDITLAGEADGVAAALTLIPTTKPDIVFLDVEMPMGNGFDLIEKIGDIDFEIIFVTAFDHYAIQALNFSAAYYLLKPVNIDELIAAVEKIRSKRLNPSPSLQAMVLSENKTIDNPKIKKIILPLIDGFEVVKIEDIVCCTAHDNFTDFHFTHKPKMMICRTLRYYEELLAEAGFMRVHKSHLVNLDHVAKYARGKGGELLLSNGLHIPVSPQKKEALLAHFRA
jgi:two-component system, LytTR family, response regulator